MGMSKQRGSYADCAKLLQDALNTSKGLKVRCEDKGAAVQLRTRLNVMRRMDRLDNKRTYPPEHPLYGNSAYDVLAILLEEVDGGWWYVRIEKLSERSFETTPIEE